MPPRTATAHTNNVTRNIVSTTGLNGVVFGNFAWDAHYTHGETRLSTTGLFNGNNQFHDAAQDAVLVQNGNVVCYNDTAAAIALVWQYLSRLRADQHIRQQCDDGRAIYLLVEVDAFRRDQHHGRYRRRYFGQSLPFAGWSGQGGAGGRNALARLFDQFQRLADRGGQLHGPSPLRQRRWNGPRRQSGQRYPDLVGQQHRAFRHASENVWEFSGEIGVPILKDIPLVQNLDADLAGRYTNYSVSGSVETWKVGLDWHVNDSVRFRGTTSVDIRAPTLNDLYSPKVSNSGPFLDPLTNFNPGGIQTVSWGNPNLKPEVSRTYTGGVVLTPSFIPGLTMSADYYQIKLTNAITTISGSNTAIANLCIASGGTSPFCTLYVRPSRTPTPRRPTIPRSSSNRASTRRLMRRKARITRSTIVSIRRTWSPTWRAWSICAPC